ncbi:hypothetical protein T484DRAFT_1943522 [Baffinella frigidus]|nr:hypothetical protein T484DRAFT_1943522 [Cryptophyta sp. CCMP2293]
MLHPLRQIRSVCDRATRLHPPRHLKLPISRHLKLHPLGHLHRARRPITVLHGLDPSRPDIRRPCRLDKKRPCRLNINRPCRLDTRSGFPRPRPRSVFS